MQIGSDHWNDILVQGTARIGLTLSSQQMDRMRRHALSLLEWNRKINLTAITDPKEVAIKHFLDSVLPIEHIPENGPLLDMGTGGGFPGIPLKILRPGQSMILVDTSRKKINFVKHVIRQLDLQNIAALQMRIEDMAQAVDFRNRFQVIVCRAFADLVTIIRLAMPLLSPSGSIVVYQGPGEDARQSMGKGTDSTSFKDFFIFEYKLPFSGDQRTLVVLRP